MANSVQAHGPAAASRAAPVAITLDLAMAVCMPRRSSSRKGETETIM